MAARNSTHSGVVSESEFRERIQTVLGYFIARNADWVTGPGRSGAIAAVYASHILGIPFVPYGHQAPGRPLVIDTASLTGATIRKAMRRLSDLNPISCVVYREPPRVRFWYEAAPPQPEPRP